MTNPIIDVKPMHVPADYASLGVETGYCPKPPEAVRLFVDGPPGEGKTTFVASIPDNLILDFESGANAIPGARAHRVNIKGYEHYAAVKQKLLEDAKANKRVYCRVTIDTGDEWGMLIAGQLAVEHKVEDITEFGREGLGWRLIRDRCWRDLQEFYMAGYAWAVVGHITEKTITNPVTHTEVTVLRSTMAPSLISRIVRNCEFHATIWRLTTQEQETETIVVQGRKIERPRKEVKTIRQWFFDCRSVDGKVGKERGVPTMNHKFELPLVGGWDRFVEEYNKAIETIRKGEIT